MANFCRKAVGARIELVTQHQAPADAGTQRHHQETGMVAAVAVQLLAERGRGRVVLDGDRTAEALGQLFADRHAFEVRHVGEPPAAALCVHFARNGDANRVGLRCQRQDRVGDRIQHVLRPGVETRRRSGAPDDFAPVDNAGFDRRSSKIDSNQHATRA